MEYWPWMHQYLDTYVFLPEHAILYHLIEQLIVILHVHLALYLYHRSYNIQVMYNKLYVYLIFARSNIRYMEHT